MDLSRLVVHLTLSVGRLIPNLHRALFTRYSPVSVHDWRCRYRRSRDVWNRGFSVRTDMSGGCVRRTILVRICRRRIRPLRVILLYMLILHMIIGDHLRPLLRNSLLHNLVRCRRRHLSTHLVLKVVRQPRGAPCIHVGVACHPRTLVDTLIVRICKVDDRSWPNSRGLSLGNGGLPLLGRRLLSWLLLGGWH